VEGRGRRKIRLIEGNAKNCPIKGLCRRFYLSEAKNPIPPPLYTLCTVYLFTPGRGEGEEVNQREGERGNSSQS